MTWAQNVVSAQSIGTARFLIAITFSSQSELAMTDRARFNKTSLHSTVDGAKLLVTARICSWHAIIINVVVESGLGFSDKLAAIVCIRYSAS